MKQPVLDNLLANCIEHGDLELIKVDIQVRSSGAILPPSWAKAMRELRKNGPEPKVNKPWDKG